MSIQPITQAELDREKVASLPARPNASTAFGGRGYTSAELREAFDRLPLLLAQRYNDLVEAIGESGEDSLAAHIPTGIPDATGEDYSLAQVLAHIRDGTFAAYLKVGGTYLAAALAGLAPLASPTLTGTPTAPTPAASDNSSRLATTAWVQSLLAGYDAFYQSVMDGTHGEMPEGGATGALLAKASESDNDVCWRDPATYTFPDLHVADPQDDTATRAANVGYVNGRISEAIAALKGGVSTAYDTLQELAEAIEESSGEISDALTLIAEREVKTVRTVFPASGVLTPQNNTEYVAASPLSSFALTFPADPPPGYMATLEFGTASGSTFSYSLRGGSYYATGADCDEGTFYPIAGAWYTIVLWYVNQTFQMVVRRAE